MKKNFWMTGVLALSVVLLAGCGADEKQQETETATQETQVTYPDEAYLENLNVDDFVELDRDQYQGMTISLAAASVSDEQIDEEIQAALSNNPKRTEITDRAAQEGDLTDISYVGKKDGAAFDGGTADHYELELGSGTFIDGFEDGVIGMKKGEEKDLNLTFPEDYNDAELAGQDVVFTVTLNTIYELSEPELDDAFVSGLGIENVETVEQYRQYLYDRDMESAQQQYENDLENAVLDAAYQNAVFKKDATEMEARYRDRLVNTNYSYATTLAAMYGVDLETYLGMTWEEYVAANEDDIAKSANLATKQILMLQKIAQNEGLTVTEEEIEEGLTRDAEEYGYESVEDYKEALGEELQTYGEYLLTGKVIDYLVENANVTDPGQEE